MISRRNMIFSLITGLVLPVAHAGAQKHAPRRDRPQRPPPGRFPPPRRRDRPPPGLRRRPPPPVRKRMEQRARDLQKRGKIRPLFELIRKLETNKGGAVLDAIFLERAGNRAYVFDLLLPDGRKTKFVVDAASGEIFTVQEARKHYLFD